MMKQFGGGDLAGMLGGGGAGKKKIVKLKKWSTIENMIFYEYLIIHQKI